jgi:hypothetical protein
MTTASPVSPVASIGEAAGAVWRILADCGPTSLAKLVKAVDEPRDVVMQALGWLAREDKIDITAQGNTRVVSLR